LEGVFQADMSFEMNKTQTIVCSFIADALFGKNILTPVRSTGMPCTQKCVHKLFKGLFDGILSRFLRKIIPISNASCRITGRSENVRWPCTELIPGAF